MSIKFVVLAICFFQASLGARVVREDAVQLEDLSKQTSDFLALLGNQFNSVVTAKDSTQLQEILKTNTETLAGKVSEIAKSLQEQLGSTTGEVSNVVNQVVAKLNETITNLQTQNPEITNMVKESQEKLQESLKTVVGEFDKVTKSLAENSKGVQEDLSKLTKKAYDQVLQTAQTIQKDIHEAANKQ